MARNGEGPTRTRCFSTAVLRRSVEVDHLYSCSRVLIPAGEIVCAPSPLIKPHDGGKRKPGQEGHVESSSGAENVPSAVGMTLLFMSGGAAPMSFWGAGEVPAVTSKPPSWDASKPMEVDDLIAAYCPPSDAAPVNSTSPAAPASGVSSSASSVASPSPSLASPPMSIDLMAALAPPPLRGGNPAAAAALVASSSILSDAKPIEEEAIIKKPGLLAARDLRSRKRSASVISSAVHDDSQTNSAEEGSDRGGSRGDKKPRSRSSTDKAGDEKRKEGQAGGGRWRASRMADDYVNLVGDLMYPKVSAGQFGYDSTTGELPLERPNTLGALLCPTRKPTVIERWSPWEVACFEGALTLLGKNFHLIARLLPAKTCKEVVEFYYVWKMTSHYKQWKASFEPLDPHPFSVAPEEEEEEEEEEDISDDE